MPSSSYIAGRGPGRDQNYAISEVFFICINHYYSHYPSIMSKNKSKSNVALLTEGQSYIARAKKERREQVESIKFDDDARRLAHSVVPWTQLISGNG